MNEHMEFEERQKYLASLSENERNQKNNELFQLERFISVYDKEITIIKFQERPDFIVSKKGKLIGIELTELPINQENKRKEGTIRQTLTDVEKFLISDESLKGLYRIEFNEGVVIKKKNKKNVSQEIIEIIRGNELNPQYVKLICKKPANEFSIYHSEAYMLNALKRENILKTIQDKEGRIKNYDVVNLDEIWLLMVTSGLNKSDNYSYDKEEEDVLKLPFETSYNKVFLLNLFEHKIIELPITPIKLE